MTATIRPLLALYTRALREDNRAKFPTITRTVAVLFLLLLVWLNQSDFTNQSAPGLQLLMMLAMVNFFGLTITGLGTFCSSITEEKEDETLGLLRMTRLNPLAILLGKSTARFTSGLLFLAVQLPFTMLCATLGGVSFGQILQVYAILAAYLFFLCNLGLLWSVLSRRTSRAVSLTTVSLVLLYILPSILYFATASWVRGMAGTSGIMEKFLGALISYSPFYHLIGTLIPFGGGFPIKADSILPSLIGGTGCFLLAWAVFDRFCSEQATTSTTARPRKNPAANRARHPRAWLRAIAWKDFHFGLRGTQGIVIRFVLYSVMILGILGFVQSVSGSRSLRANAIGPIVITMAIIIFSVELGVLASRIFGTERKRKTLGSLYILPQATSRLIGQKTLAGILSLIPSILLFIIGQLILASDENYRFSDDQAKRTLFLILYFISQYLFFAILVTYLSLRMRRGALLLGFLGVFLGNIIAQIGMSYFVFRSSAMGNYQDAMINYQIVISIFLTTAALSLAFLIPRRLAHCAAED